MIEGRGASSWAQRAPRLTRRKGAERFLMLRHDVNDPPTQKCLAHGEQIGTMPIALLKRVHAQIEDQGAFAEGIKETIARLEMRFPRTKPQRG